MPPLDEDDFEAQFDLETLQRAQRIKGSPERMARVKAKADQLAKIASDDADGQSADEVMRKGFRKLS